MISFLRFSLARLMRGAVPFLALMGSALHLSSSGWAKSGEAPNREPQESLAPLIATLSNSDAFDRRLAEELRPNGTFDVAQAELNQPQQTIMTDRHRITQRKRLQQAAIQDPIKRNAGRKTLQQATMVDPVRLKQGKTLQQATMVDPVRPRQDAAPQQAVMTDPYRSKQRKTLQPALTRDPIKPGLLERDSGFSQQGPAAIGTSIAPSGSTRGGGSGGGLR